MSDHLAGHEASAGELPTAEVKWISCNACGIDNFTPLSTVDRWTIGKCNSCGLIYVNPIPFFAPTQAFSHLSKAFQYTRYMHRPITPAILAFEKQQLESNVCELERLTGRRKESEAGIRFLDIGCGSGAVVRAASDLGWGAIGIDLDPELIREGKEQLDIDLRCTPLLDSGLPNESFDFIKMRDLIEHLPNPYDALVKIKGLLAPEGIALIVTPNEAGLVTRARLALGLKRNRVATVAPPHHLHGFDEHSMRRICERAELEVYELRTTTPVDPGYVTFNNMRSSSNTGMNLVWRLGKAMGMGATLFAWVGR